MDIFKWMKYVLFDIIKQINLFKWVFIINHLNIINYKMINSHYNTYTNPSYYFSLAQSINPN